MTTTAHFSSQTITRNSAKITKSIAFWLNFTLCGCRGTTALQVRYSFFGCFSVSLKLMGIM